MNKKFILLGCLLILALCISGCRTTNQLTSRSPEDFFKDFKSFEATTTLTFLKDKQPNIIKMTQKANLNGTYEMVVIVPEYLKGMHIINDGETISQYDANQNELLNMKKSTAQNEILITTFIQRYQANENIKEQELQLNGKKATVFEIPIEGDFKYMKKEQLWLDSKNQIPIQLVIYDCEDNVSIQVVYEDFKMNVEDK